MIILHDNADYMSRDFDIVFVGNVKDLLISFEIRRSIRRCVFQQPSDILK